MMRSAVFGGALLFSALVAGTASAEPPLLLSHSLTGTTQSPDSTTLRFRMHAVNIGDKPIADVTLSYVPLSILSLQDLRLDVGNLDAGAELDLYFDIVTPLLLTDREFVEHPLFWAGECLDGGANLIKFPAESRPDWAGGVP